MKVISVFVASLDGKTTQGSNPDIHIWSSKEETNNFRKLLEKAHLIVMGSKTYDASKNSMQHHEGRLRVIMTQDPNRYINDTIPGQLEFSSESPRQLVERLAKQEYEEMLMIGGEKVNELFFKDGVVTDLWLSIEPKLLGTGNGIAGNVEADLKLESVEKLNDKGTLLLKYKVPN